MYTEKELKKAADIIRQMAQEYHVPERQIRTDMEEAINAGRNNPDPAIQARWAAFPCTGREPAVEEFILWVAEMPEGMER